MNAATAGGDGRAAAAPLGVYVHIPFCVRKCQYCAFNSYPVAEPAVDPLVDRYTRALLLEVESVAALVEGDAGPRPATLYFGGGTPTCIGASRLARVVSACTEAFNLPDGSEVTVECNPATVDLPGLRTLRDAGVNRLSVGAQAFQDNLLGRLGRVHTAADVDAVVQAARSAGFANLNLDLMFGIPGQWIREWEESLRRAVDLGPEHVSIYPLEVEEGTPLYGMVSEGSEVLPAEDEVVEMWEAALDRLARAGYARYEISNYSKPGFESRHNLIYWLNGDYVGLGAGACSHLSGVRRQNLAGPEEYCDAVESGLPPVVSVERLSSRTQMVETVIMGLRLTAGLSLEGFRSRFRCDLDDVFPGVIGKLEALGLLCRDGGAVRLTRRGLFLANVVFREFASE
ncbi:MAG: radical SAM family heme chaperone HemW [Firmicutes bacterium]|nr:radical SAM family heme chaperone HemW [Bacillota bacterium]